ncbi:MAG: adenylate/guanylate cyclase domain-containing protein [Alphaproteobacteria bacterium]|nr:adenylate/guanylate cyclase domain-containing protein [Alphaproteobacteria bacterium]
MAQEPVQRRLAAILAADMVGYSRLIGVDEAGTIARQKAHRAELIDPKIAEHSGRVVKTTGDGLLVEFASAVDAVLCAVEIQRAMGPREAKVPEDRRIAYRVGINLGEIVIDGEDILGDGVNVAARLEGLAEPGGIRISDVVFKNVKGKLDLGFADLGPQKVKNIAEAVPTYRVLIDPADIGKFVAAKRRRPTSPRWAAGAVAAVLVLASGGLAIWRPWELGMEPASREETALPLPDKPSIAVLPFDNLSGDPKQEYLSDGITESLITRLARQPDMFVIARNSSFTYKGKAVKVQQIGRDLGVRYVLEGSVQKAGERIRITAQLVEAATGEHLWADSYDRQLNDLFAVQDEIARKVAVELAVKLTVGEVARSDVQATDNVEAYDLWLRGVEAYRKFKKETNVQAGELFEKAIALDPQYARAIGYLGWVRLNEWRFWWGEDRDRSFRQAEELARRAIAIDEDSIVGHNLLSRIYSFTQRHEPAIAQGHRTVAIEPSSANGYASLAWTMVLAGRPEDGLVFIGKALRLSPYPPVWYRNVEVNISYLTGRYEAAIASARKLLDRTRVGAMARGTWKLSIASYVELGREAEAGAEAKKYLENDPDFSVQEFADVLPRAFGYMDQSSQDRFIDALRTAGLPE